MKSILKKYIFLSLAGTLVATSCTNKFDEMNVDPNNPTAIGPQYLLPYALEKSVDRYWGGNVRFERLNIDGAMLWIQYSAIFTPMRETIMAFHRLFITTTGTRFSTMGC